MPSPNIERRLAAALLAGAALFAHAELADRDKPAHVDADTVDVDQKTGLRTLNGDVRLTQGTLSMFADRTTILQLPDGSMKATGEGRPVRFKQKMEASPDWMEGHADRIEYDNKSGDVHLLGNAWVKKGGDEVTSPVISYNTITEKYRAEGKAGVANSTSTPTGGGRVHIDITPTPKPGAAQPVQGAAKP